MNRLIIGISLVFLILSFGSQAGATNWYVDNAAAGSNNGKSWTDAWESFAKINWSSVSCGDTIYISGGSTGTTKTYAEALTVGKSCTAGSPLTITVGTGSSHNGTVKISPKGTGITITNKNYITIDGQSGGDGQRHIEITGRNTMPGLYISGTSVSSDIRYLYLHDIGLTNNNWHRAVLYEFSTNDAFSGHELSYSLINNTVDCIDVLGPEQKAAGYGGVKIHHNTISCWDDGIQPSGSTDIYNNDISRATYIGVGHPDGIQVYGSYVRIYNNYFHGFLDYEAGNSVIYFEPDGAHNMNFNGKAPCCYQVYNNVFYETRTASASMTAIQCGWSDPDWKSLRDVYIVNNTIIGAFRWGYVDGWGGTTLDKSAVTNFYIMNNIFYNPVSSGRVAWGFSRPSYIKTPVNYGSYGSGASIIVDYNICYGTGAAQVGYLGTLYNYAGWKATSGCQASGLSKNPLLDSNLKPLSSSPAVNKGHPWTSLFTTDKDGVERGTSWSMGAYENTVGSAAPKPLK